MTNALLIDTSTDMLSVAYGSSAENVTHSSMKQHSQQSENILTAIDNVIKQQNSTIKDVDVIGVGIGPGMFTGVRVGVTCAHSLAHALDAKLVYLSSLEIAALSSLGEKEGRTSSVGKDARRSELYCAQYCVGSEVHRCVVDGVAFASISKRIREECLLSPKDFVESLSQDMPIAIDSTDTYPELKQIRNHIPLRTDISKSIDLVLSAYKEGIFADIFDPSILYLRKSDAELSWGK